MALLGTRRIIDTDITCTLSDVAEPGVVVCYNVAGSGQAIGDTAGSVTLAASASGQVVAGILMNNFVNIDQTKTHRNFHKDEMVIGEKATVLRKGWVITNKVTGTPTKGAKAYLTSNGIVTPTNGGAAATPFVGQFEGIVDENGYVKLSVNFPTNY